MEWTLQYLTLTDESHEYKGCHTLNILSFNHQNDCGILESILCFPLLPAPPFFGYEIIPTVIHYSQFILTEQLLFSDIVPGLKVNMLMKIEPQTVKAIKDESVSIPHEYP